MLRLLGILIIAITLAGCYADQKQAYAGCDLETKKIYPDERPNAFGNVEPYLVMCMQSKGYELNPQSNNCALTLDYPTLIYCYKPSRRTERFLQEIEIMLFSYD